MFCQNVEIWHNKQQKTRSISLYFREDRLNDRTRIAFEKLLAIPKEDKACVIIEILKKRKLFETSFYDEYQIALADMTQVPPGRVRNNYSLVLAWHRMFCKAFSIESEIFQSIEAMAIEKERLSKELNTNPATTFFEMLQISKSEQLKHYWVQINEPGKRNHGIIYFSFLELHRVLVHQGFPVPKTDDIQQALKLHPSYLGHGQNYLFPLPDDDFGRKRADRKKAWRLDAVKFIESENIHVENNVQFVD